MIVRNCSGGIVFFNNKVLLLMNDKRDWAFPKGVVRADQKYKDVAVERVKIEAGIEATVIAPCGKTHYEFYSVSRRKPVHNNISWFVMKASDDKVVVDDSEGFADGGFFTVEEALEKITYSQDKSLLMVAYQRYKETA